MDKTLLTQRSDANSPNSIHSHNQVSRATSRETGFSPEDCASGSWERPFSGSQSMEDASTLPRTQFAGWDVQEPTDLTMNCIDPALVCETWPSATEPWSYFPLWHDQSMGQWNTATPLDSFAQPILRMDEFLQFWELSAEQWQIPWVHRNSLSVTSNVCDTSGEKFVFPEDNEWSLPPASTSTLLAEKHFPAHRSTPSAVRLRLDADWHQGDDMRYDVQHDALTYYGHSLQKPEKDPKIAADDASSDGEPFDVGEMVMDGRLAADVYSAHYRAFSWVFCAWLRSVSTYAAVLTLFISRLRQERYVTALNGWPGAEEVEDVDEPKASKPLGLPRR